MILQKQLNENGKMIRNKERFVRKGYAQVEGINFEETFAPVERLQGNKIFLAFSCYKKFNVYQMDVKSAFLKRKLEEEVYIEQLGGFLLS